MLPQQSIKGLLLTHSKFARLDTGVVHAQKGVHVVHRLRTDICEFLDLGSSILNLSINDVSKSKKFIFGDNRSTDLFVCQRQPELLDSGLDGVPTCQTVSLDDDG